MSDDRVTLPTPMHDSRARALAALVYREGGHLEISLDEMLAAPDSLIVTSTESGSIVLRDSQAHEWDGQDPPADLATAAQQAADNVNTALANLFARLGPPNNQK